MAENHSEHAEHSEHEHIGIPGYLGVFAILIIGTWFTYESSHWDLDKYMVGANTLLALAIAFTKMAFVVLYFMHVRWGGKFIWLAAVGSFFWLAIMFAFTMQDYLTRGSGIFAS